jgi:DNA-binding winged helix-turn-helix (wHTH) protein
MAPQDFRIGSWLVRPNLNRIESQQEGVRHLEPKVMQVLLLLAANSGQLVSRAQLMQMVWGDVSVTDDVLTRAIYCPRKALNEDHNGGGLIIETISKSGYRLVHVQAACIDSSLRTYL